MAAPPGPLGWILEVDVWGSTVGIATVAVVADQVALLHCSAAADGEAVEVSVVKTGATVGCKPYRLAAESSVGRANRTGGYGVYGGYVLGS